MRFSVLHFNRHDLNAYVTVDPETRQDITRREALKRKLFMRTDIALVNVDWPNGTFNQYAIYHDEAIPGLARKFLSVEDVKKIQEEAEAVAKMLKGN